VTDWIHDWLVGANGVYHSGDGIHWQARGGTGHLVTDLIRRPEQLLCATMAGVWQVDSSPEQWVQLHDETLTEVLGIAADSGDPGVVAVSPYGLAFGRSAEHGGKRWRSCSDDLSLNERFSNAVLAHPQTQEHWLVGTEAGVLIYVAAENRWERTELAGVPCRALLHAHGALWAGTDGGGIWRSVDGAVWSQAGTDLDHASIFSLSATADQILAGTLAGIVVGDGDSSWQRSGPSLLVSAVAAHPDEGGPWLVGANPGGLWRSEDGGTHWGQVGDFDSVRMILAPERTT
jgi:ligand-binding sensor domain-containing protein